MEDTMKKVIILCILLALSFSTYSCGGGAGSLDSPGGENPGTPSVVRLMPSHYIAQTNSFISLHVKVLDGNGDAVKGVPVTFTNLSEPFGVIQELLKFIGIHKSAYIVEASTVNTNDLGIATVKLTSTTQGFATIQAEVNTGAGIIRDKKTVYFTTTTGSTTNPPPTLTLHVDDGDGKYDEPADFDLLKTSGDNARTIKAVVRDGFGVPFSGVQVTFGSDSPSEITFDRNTVSTGTGTEAGNAYVIMTVNPANISKLKRYININATADTNKDGTYETPGMLTLFLEPVTVSSIAVSANPSVLTPNGTSTIRAIVSLNTGSPTPDGSSVGFTASCGFITPFGQTTGGVATATFTAPSIPPSSGICTVTASIGGQSGTADVHVTTSLTVQPTPQTINGVIGGSVVYTIFGGVPAYKVSSSNPGIAFNTTPGNGIWNVTASGETFSVTVPHNTSPQSVTLTIKDQVGTTVTATLTIGGGTSLSVQPSSQTIDGSSNGDATFKIFGGAPGYSVFADTANPNLQPDPPNVALDGDPFTIHVIADTPTTDVVYTVRDSLGATTTAKLSITNPVLPALKVSPTSASIDGGVGGTVTFTIIGGKPGYIINSSNPSILPSPATVPSSGGMFNITIPPGTAAQTITYTVIDQASASITITVTVTAPAGGAANLLIVPGSVTVVSLASAQSVDFTISGGTPSYITTSTDPANAYDSSPGDGIFNGSPITVNIPANATGGDVTLNVFDSVGGTTSAKLTIVGLPAPPTPGTLKVNPSTVSVTGESGTADQVTFTVTGGSGTYTSVVSTNTAVIPLPTWVDATHFRIDPNPVATSTPVTLTVIDNAGTPATATVTVTPASSSLAINPSSISVTNGTTITFNIIGGLPNFTVYSSDTSILTIGSGCGNPGGPCVFSGTFNANAVLAGTATITVVDSDGNTKTATVTIN
jgi:hypothetical protein